MVAVVIGFLARPLRGQQFALRENRAARQCFVAHQHAAATLGDVAAQKLIKRITRSLTGRSAPFRKTQLND
jgi:hypothetical protein